MVYINTPVCAYYPHSREWSCYECCQQHRITPVALHLPGVSNSLEAFLSRQSLASYEWSLQSSIIQQISQSGRAPQKTSSPPGKTPNVQLFALGKSVELKPHLCLFPNFPRVICMIRQVKATVTLMASYWLRQFCVRNLLQMSTQSPISLPDVSQNNDYILHLAPKWPHLTVWTLADWEPLTDSAPFRCTKSLYIVVSNIQEGPIPQNRSGSPYGWPSTTQSQ